MGNNHSQNKSGYVRVQFGVNNIVYPRYIVVTSTELSIYQRNENYFNHQVAIALPAAIIQRNENFADLPVAIIRLTDLLNIDISNNNNVFQLLFNNKQYPIINIYCPSKSEKTAWISLFEKYSQNVILTKELQTTKESARKLGFSETEVESALVKYHEKYGTMYNIHEFVYFVIQEHEINDDELGKNHNTFTNNDELKYLEVMDEKCMKNANDCVHIKRVIQMLHKFETIILRIQNRNRNDKFDISISDHLFSSKQSKERIHLMRDFVHIQQHHNKSNIDRKYYQSKLNHHCAANDDNKSCDKELRHRNVERDFVQYNKIRNITMDQEEDINDINLIQLIDTIHCSLLHKTISKSSKFTTNIEINNNVNANEQTKYQHHDQYQNLPKYHFGIAFNVNSRYLCLKEEFFRNTMYQLTPKQYQCLHLKANDFVECYKRNFLYAQREPEYRSNIHCGDPMDLEHIMAVMSYCNIDGLQRAFKDGFRATDECDQKYNERTDNQYIRDRQYQIAIWSRLLLESVTLFGDQFVSEDKVYHGLNCKLQFDHLSAVFSMPTSTTVSLEVAQRFAVDINNGIILELTRAAPNDARNCYLDVYSKYIFSNYPNEQERLIFGTGMGFSNIIYEDMVSELNHKEEIMSLRLYQAIIYGLYYSHRTYDIFKVQYQQNIVQYIKIVMNDNDNNESNVDSYILYLFKCISANAKFICLIKSELKKLSIELRQLLLNGYFDYLQKHFSKSVNFAKIINLTTCIDNISSAKTKGIKSSVCKYQIDNECLDVYVVLKTIYESLENKTYFDALITVKKIQENVAVDIVALLWIKKISFDNYLDGTLTLRNMHHGGHMFEMSKIAHLDRKQLFDVKIAILDVTIKDDQDLQQRYYYKNAYLSNCTVRPERPGEQKQMFDTSILYQ